MDYAESRKNLVTTLAIGFFNAIAFGLNAALIVISFATDNFGGQSVINPLIFIFALINGVAAYHSWKTVRDALSQKA